MGCKALLDIALPLSLSLSLSGLISCYLLFNSVHCSCTGLLDVSPTWLTLSYLRTFALVFI